MSSFSMKVGGLDKITKRINDKSIAIKEEVQGEIESSGQVIVRNAKQRAPIDTGYLRQSVAINPIPNGIELTVNAKYAPYIEFGTGAAVNIPNELVTYAQQFKGKGLRQTRLPARPFFFNSFFEERPKLLKRIKELLKR